MCLNSFWEALKPEQQFPENNHNRAIHMKMIKPVPRLGDYPPRLRRVHFPPGKGYSKAEVGFPARNALNG